MSILSQFPKADNLIETYPGPGWQGEAFRPDSWSEAFHLGFELGLEGEDPAIPAELPGYEARAFEAGLVAGERRRQDEDDAARAELEVWLDAISPDEEMEDRYRYFHPNEVIEAIGAVEARKG